MSWSIQKKGKPATVLAEVKADPGAPHVPAGLSLLVEELLAKTKGTVILATSGHVYEGLGEIHLTIEQAAPEVEEPKEEMLGGPEPAVSTRAMSRGSWRVVMADSLPSLPTTFSAKEFAKACGVSSETALRWASEQRVAHVRIGGRIRFPESSVQEAVRVFPAKASKD